MPKDPQAFGTVFYIPVCERAHYENCMNDIQIFKNEAFGEVRVVGTSEEPLFCLSDVCKVLELGNSSQVKTRLCDGVITNEVMLDSLGRPQEMIFINEDGLYDVILDSRKPQAKAFRKWITGDVLPSIRKTGGYSIEKKLPKTYLEALKELVVVVEEKERLALENTAMKPKADYFDKLVDRNLLTNLRDTAKELKIHQNTFISLLLENKYIYRDAKRKLKPYAEHTPSLFELKDYEHNGYTGTQLFITPRGKETFRLMFSA